MTQDNEFKACNFYFGGGTNATTNTPSVEMFTLGQNLENTGTQSADQRSTNEIKPDTDVTVGGMGGSGKGLLEQAVGALVTPSTAAKECPDGNCSTGACTDGSCSE